MAIAVLATKVPSPPHHYNSSHCHSCCHQSCPPCAELAPGRTNVTPGPPSQAMFSDSDGKTKSTKDKAAKPKAAPQEAAMAEPEGERPHGIGDLASLVSGGTYGKTVGEMGELYRDAKRPRL
mmetsp:Transcript_21798/g.68365  ORF Transcript_21798/g.68365 Transcript_21798/m.68365 type:complete len:122 (-) Transcript_21798:126-491(-)